MTGNERPRVGGLLLAAGASRRFGRPKQLVEIGGKTLIRRAAEALSGCGCDAAAVVLGAEIEGSRAEVSGLGIEVVENAAWETGMSSSIRAGLGRLLAIEPALDAVLITLCDQPKIDAAALLAFVSRYREDRHAIVAAEYDGVRGVPALFDKDLFDALMALEGDKGARELIRNGDGVVTIGLSGSGIDIDAEEDIRRLLREA